MAHLPPTTADFQKGPDPAPGHVRWSKRGGGPVVLAPMSGRPLEPVSATAAPRPRGGGDLATEVGGSLEELSSRLLGLLMDLVQAAGLDFGRLSILEVAEAPLVLTVGRREPGGPLLTSRRDVVSAADYVERPSSRGWCRLILNPGSSPYFTGQPSLSALFSSQSVTSVFLEPIHCGSRLVGSVVLGTKWRQAEFPAESLDLLTAAAHSLAYAAEVLAWYQRSSRQATMPLPLPRRPLTARQREILMMLAAGLRVQTIATRLCLSENTVRNHVKAILHAYGLSRQAELVSLIYDETRSQ